MSQPVGLSVCFAVLTLLSVAACAQVPSPSASERSSATDNPEARRGEALLRAGYAASRGAWTEAEQAMRVALEAAERVTPAAWAETLWLYAALLDGQRKHDESTALLSSGLARLEKVRGPRHPFVGETLHRLAETYAVQRKYALAESMAVRALMIAEEALRPDFPHVASRRLELAAIYLVQGKHAEAEPLVRQSLEAYEGTLGPDHWAVAWALDHLVVVLRGTRRDDEARTAEARARTTRETAHGQSERKAIEARDGPCRVWIAARRPEDPAVLQGEGFRPGSPATIVSSSGGEAFRKAETIRADGTLPVSAVLPQVIGSKLGFASFTVLGSECRPATLHYEWRLPGAVHRSWFRQSQLFPNTPPRVALAERRAALTPLHARCRAAFRFGEDALLP